MAPILPSTNTPTLVQIQQKGNDELQFYQCTCNMITKSIFQIIIFYQYPGSNKQYDLGEHGPYITLH